MRKLGINNLHKNILVVDDYQINQQIIKAILKTADCNVTIAENGEECLKILEENDFDMIFMDLMMPQLDGLATTKRIRDGNKANDMPIIALTANIGKDEEEKCLDGGMDGFVSKPIRTEAIEKILKKHFSDENAES